MIILLNNIVKERISFQSKKRFEILKNRTKRCVCKYCGGRLRLKKIIFSEYEEVRVEIFCSECDRIEFGVEPEIFSSAQFFVENSRFNCYPDLEQNENTRKMTIAKVCEIMAWQDQNLGFLDEEGFTVNLNVRDNFLGECVTLTDDDLE